MVDDGMIPPDSTMMTSWRVFFFVFFNFFFSSTLLVTFALSRKIDREYGVFRHAFLAEFKHAVDSLLA